MVQTSHNDWSGMPEHSVRTQCHIGHRRSNLKYFAPLQGTDTDEYCVAQLHAQSWPSQYMEGQGLVIGI